MKYHQPPLLARLGIISTPPIIGNSMFLRHDGIIVQYNGNKVKKTFNLTADLKCPMRALY